MNIEDEVRGMLGRRSGDSTTSPEAWAEIERRLGDDASSRRAVWPRVVLVAAAVVLVAGVAVGALAVDDGDGTSEVRAGDGGQAEPTPVEYERDVVWPAVETAELDRLQRETDAGGTSNLLDPWSTVHDYLLDRFGDGPIDRIDDFEPSGEAQGTVRYAIGGAEGTVSVRRLGDDGSIWVVTSAVSELLAVDAPNGYDGRHFRGTVVAAATGLFAPRSHAVGETGPDFDPGTIEAGVPVSLDADALGEAGWIVHLELEASDGRFGLFEYRFDAGGSAIATTTTTLPPAVATDADRALVAALTAFARDPGPDTLAAIPLTERVTLGLGDRSLANPGRDDLVRPDSWDFEGTFRGGVGPFSALQSLAEERPTVVNVGPHPHCASPPMPAPPEVATLRRVSVQPNDGESCLRWFTVDLFVDPAGQVTAITLDLWEP